MKKTCITCRYNGTGRAECDRCNDRSEWRPVTEDVEGGGEVTAQSDGSTASYYAFPEPLTELQDIISFINCNAQMGEIGRAWMRYGRCPHSPRARDLRKIIFYAQAELDRLSKYEGEE